MKKKEIPAPPMIILQATDPSAPKPPEIPDIVQQAIDKTFNLPNQPMSQTTSTGTKTGSAPRTKGGPSVSQPRPPPRWAHQKFLDSLPPIDSKFVLNDEGNIVTMSSVDHDYGQVIGNFLLYYLQYNLWHLKKPLSVKRIVVNMESSQMLNETHWLSTNYFFEFISLNKQKIKTV
jgi:hypothetical protein